MCRQMSLARKRIAVVPLSVGAILAIAAAVQLATAREGDGNTGPRCGCNDGGRRNCRLVGAAGGREAAQRSGDRGGYLRLLYQPELLWRLGGDDPYKQQRGLRGKDGMQEIT